jgi:ligand-binding SRPBCC domain-containing protein
MRTVTVSTLLEAPADVVWAAVKRPASFLAVTRHLLSVPALRGRTEPWREGETVRSWIFLFGVIPFSYHRISVASIDDRRRILRSDERGGPIRVWRHDIEVVPVSPTRCRYEDRIEIDAGILTALVTGYAHVFYRLRQRRWRKLAPTLE